MIMFQSMAIFLNLVNPLGKTLFLILASFLFWQRLKEDYPDEGIFTLTALLLVSGLFWGRTLSFLADLPDLAFNPLASFFQTSELALQGSVLGIALSAILFSRNNHWNAWQVADALIFPFLLTVFGFVLIDLFFNFSLFAVLLLVVSLLSFILLQVLGRRYRSLAWYRSGKVGFLVCFLIVAFFSGFLLLDILVVKALYWLKLIDVIIILTGLALLYYRSERDLKEDYKLILKRIKNGKH